MSGIFDQEKHEGGSHFGTPFSFLNAFEKFVHFSNLSKTPEARFQQVRPSGYVFSSYLVAAGSLRQNSDARVINNLRKKISNEKNYRSVETEGFAIAYHIFSL